MDAVEDVKSRLNIEDVIGEYVQLKRAGRNYKGLSPFGNEKTPSFVVSPEKQIWHDFSSGKGGNMFSFVMEMEGLDFKAALELLARKAGVDLSQYQTGRTSVDHKLKDRLYEALELATRFYQVQFSRNKLAIGYVFEKRKFTKQTALDFCLGYSPNTGDALVTFMKGKGFSENELQRAGLTSKRYKGTADMFRGRLMIPLMDPVGKVIGFTARLLEDDPQAPKYINTPQTILYDKSRHVYGLHLAKEALRKEKYAVLVEGNLDVIAAHQVGTKQVVATAGTALTEMHLKAINRFVGDIRLCFDQDDAGQAATERALPIASKVGVSLKILDIPSGKDPDELIKQDVEAWNKLIAGGVYGADWLIERYKKQFDLSSASGKKQFTDIVLKTIRNLTDSVEQDHYITALGVLLGVSKEALHTKMKTSPDRVAALKRKNQPVFDTALQDVTLAELIKTQDHFLSICLFQPAVRYHLKSVGKHMLEGEDAPKLHDFLDTYPEFSGDPKEIKELKPVGDYVKILSLQFEELYQGLELIELRDEAARLQVRLVEHYVKRKKQNISAKLLDANESTEKTLLEEAKELDQLLQ